MHGCLRVCRVRWLCVRDCAWLWGNCGCTLGLLFASSDSGSDETVDCRAVIQISMIQFNGSQSYSSQLKSGMNPMIKARKLRAEGYHEQDVIRLNNKLETNDDDTVDRHCDCLYIRVARHRPAKLLLNN